MSALIRHQSPPARICLPASPLERWTGRWPRGDWFLQKWRRQERSWWTSASTLTRLPLQKVWGPSLDVPRLSVRGGSEAQAFSRKRRYRIFRHGAKVHLSMARTRSGGRNRDALSVHTPRTNSCIRALAVATRLVAVHSHQPWWSFVTGCSSREPLGSMEYDARRSKSTCRRDHNLSVLSKHSPYLHE